MHYFMNCRTLCKRGGSVPWKHCIGMYTVIHDYMSVVGCTSDAILRIEMPTVRESDPKKKNACLIRQQA